MVNIDRECYVCGKKKLRVIRTKLRYDIERNVLECKSCGIIYLEPKPIPKDYYECEYRKLYTPVLGKKLSAQQIFYTFLPYQKSRIEEIKHILSPEMKVLDVGCSAGHFLYTVQNHVKECIGIEFNREEFEFARKKLGLNIYTKPIEQTDIPQEYFDLITVFQVLEHMDSPMQFLETIHKYLKPEGFLVIEIPNVQDALLSLYHIKEYSDFWFREPHVFYYSPRTLSMMLEKCGFVGETKTTQNFNLKNHINWILNRKPQGTNVEMSKPVLVDSDSANPAMKEEFNQWFQEVNEEYKKLLNKHQLGENILFIGKKKSVTVDLL